MTDRPLAPSQVQFQSGCHIQTPNQHLDTTSVISTRNQPYGTNSVPSTRRVHVSKAHHANTTTQPPQKTKPQGKQASKQAGRQAGRQVKAAQLNNSTTPSTNDTSKFEVDSVVRRKKDLTTTTKIHPSTIERTNERTNRRTNEETSLTHSQPQPQSLTHSDLPPSLTPSLTHCCSAAAVLCVVCCHSLTRYYTVHTAKILRHIVAFDTVKVVGGNHCFDTVQCKYRRHYYGIIVIWPLRNAQTICDLRSLFAP